LGRNPFQLAARHNHLLATKTKVGESGVKAISGEHGEEKETRAGPLELVA